MTKAPVLLAALLAGCGLIAMAGVQREPRPAIARACALEMKGSSIDRGRVLASTPSGSHCAFAPAVEMSCRYLAATEAVGHRAAVSAV